MLRFLLVSCALLVSCDASVLCPRASPVKPVEPKLQITLQLRGGGIVPGDAYVKTAVGIFGVYALQFRMPPWTSISQLAD